MPKRPSATTSHKDNPLPGCAKRECRNTSRVIVENGNPETDHIVNNVPAAPKYDFELLASFSEELYACAKHTNSGKLVFDFSSRTTTLALTRAILKHHFCIELNIPHGHLIPTVPNRVQYLTWALSLPSDPDSDSEPDSESESSQSLEKNPGAKFASPFCSHVLLDIGTGPSAIYALLAARTISKCRVIATDADPVAVRHASENVRLNDLSDVIQVYHTPSNSDGTPCFFPETVRKAGPTIVVCNPPFHSALNSDISPAPHLRPDSFKSDVDDPAGTTEQMMTHGGESSFIIALANQSVQMSTVRWFTSLVGRKSDLARITWHLRYRLNALSVLSVTLSPGGRTVRWAVAWSFGSSRASASISFPSPWRAQILITPGRQFAAQLVDEDLASAAELAFLQQGWKESTTPNLSIPTSVHKHDESAHRSLILSRPNTKCIMPSAHVALHVARDQSPAKFVIHIKTESKGHLTPCSFRETMDRVSACIVGTLNEQNE